MRDWNTNMIDKIFYFCAAATCLLCGVFIIVCLCIWNNAWHQSKTMVFNAIDRMAYWIIDSFMNLFSEGE